MEFTTWNMLVKDILYNALPSAPLWLEMDIDNTHLYPKQWKWNIPAAHCYRLLELIEELEEGELSESWSIRSPDTCKVLNNLYSTAKPGKIKEGEDTSLPSIEKKADKPRGVACSSNHSLSRMVVHTLSVINIRKIETFRHGHQFIIGLHSILLHSQPTHSSIHRTNSSTIFSSASNSHRLQRH